MKKNIITIGILTLVIVATLSGCTRRVSHQLQMPRVTVTGEEMWDGYKDSEYVVYNSVAVFNNGAGGLVAVWVQLTTKEGISCKYSQSVYIDYEQTKDLLFVFDKLWFDSLDDVTSSVWVTAVTT